MYLSLKPLNTYWISTITNCNKFQHPRFPQEWNLEWEFLSKLPKLSNCMLCMVDVIRYMRADTCDQIHVGHHIVSTWQKCSRLYQDSSTYLLCFYLLWTKQWCHRPSQLLLPVLWVLQQSSLQRLCLWRIPDGLSVQYRLCGCHGFHLIMTTRFI